MKSLTPGNMELCREGRYNTALPGISGTRICHLETILFLQGLQVSGNLYLQAAAGNVQDSVGGCTLTDDILEKFTSLCWKFRS